ncbi:MAG: BCCT family transporter [Lachnospiraceae bacterium]|nr:BCCT family transporter [Lachnospiraceae bacterium]
MKLFKKNNSQHENVNMVNEEEIKGKNITLKEAKERGLRWGVAATPVIIFTTLIIIGVVNPEAFLTYLNAFFKALMINGGWLASLGCFFFVLFMIACIVCPFGRIRIGGKNAKPLYSTWNWFAISLCAGIGTGIMFWGAVEPLMMAVSPAPGMHLEPNSSESVIWGLRTSFLHWSFTPYSIYMCFGVIIAFAYYNLKKPYNVSSGFTPLLGDKVTQSSKFCGIIDTLTVFAISGGVAGSLGYGLLQVGGGISSVMKIPTSAMLYVTICAVIVITYNISSVSGMDKGIKWLSDKNAWMFMVLMLAALLIGPTQYIFNLFTQATGAYFNHFMEAALWTNPFADVGTCVGNLWTEASELWSQWWDQYWWVDWLSFGPITGLFLVKLMYGRTIREVAMVNWVLPSAFAFIWFSIFGGLALDIQYNPAAYPQVDLEGCATLYDYMQKFGNEYVMLKIIEVFPFATVIKIVVLLLVMLSFVTLADSMTSTISLMTIKNNVGVNEAPMQIKLCWGILMGATSLIFTLTGGLDGIKIVKTLAGFPILFIEAAMVICFIIYIIKHGKDPEVKEMMID